MIVNFPGIAIIGKSSSDNRLVDPRALIPVNTPQGQGIQISTLFETPKSITIRSVCFQYIPRDKDIIQAYLQSVSGITLAQNLPDAASLCLKQ